MSIWNVLGIWIFWNEICCYDKDLFKASCGFSVEDEKPWAAMLN